MTRFTVVWHRDAENALAQVWLDGNDRDQISAAATSIERDLSNDADQKGRLVGDQLYVLHRPPLEILFDVSVPDRIARVVPVRRRDVPGR